MTNRTADQQVLEAFVAEHFDDRTVRWREGHTVADVSCPGPLHENGDRNPSATVKLGDEQRVILFKCHKEEGCKTEDVLKVLGLTYADLDLPGRERPRPVRPTPDGTLTLTDVQEAYAAYQGEDDLAMLWVVLAAVASHELEGDPLWPAVIGAPSSGKTEVLNAILGLPDVHPVSKLSAAGLLSGSSKRDRSAASTGGLLKAVGESGIVVFKDFTTLLSDNPDSQTETLGLLREVYDGRVDRHAGSDGGVYLVWQGKVTAIVACTEALDEAHTVRATMGERFVMIRQGVDATQDRRRGSARRAMRNPAETRERRKHLHTVIRAFLSSERVRTGDGQHMLTDEVEGRIADLADLVSRARSAVIRDRHRREIESVPEPEFPARLAKELAKLWRALGVLGLDPATSWKVVVRVSFDSMPLLRWRCLAALAEADGLVPTTKIVEDVDRPKRTVLRALEDLDALRVIRRVGGYASGEGAMWQIEEEFGEVVAEARKPLTERVESVPAIRSVSQAFSNLKDNYSPTQSAPNRSAGTLSPPRDLAVPLTFIEHSDDLAAMPARDRDVRTRFLLALDGFDPDDDPDLLASLAEPCPESPMVSPEFDVLPMARNATESGWLAHYVCPWCGYGWTSHHTDMEGITA